MGRAAAAGTVTSPPSAGAASMEDTYFVGSTQGGLVLFDSTSGNVPRMLTAATPSLTPSRTIRSARHRLWADGSFRGPNSSGRQQPAANVTRPSLKTAGALSTGFESLFLRRLATRPSRANASISCPTFSGPLLHQVTEKSYDGITASLSWQEGIASASSGTAACQRPSSSGLYQPL